MKYDFAHPRFRNGMVTFDEKKPDLLYEFRKAAAFHRYDVRNGILYSPDKKQIATVYNRFDSVFIHMLKNKKIYRLGSKKDIDLFFNDLKESFIGYNNMKLDEALETLKDANMIVEKNSTVTVDTAEIDHELEILQKRKMELTDAGKEVAEFLSANDVSPTDLGIGKDYDGRYVLWIGFPKNRWYSVAVYDDGIEINVDGEYSITTTKEKYLQKLLKAIKK
jgi:hypothetical protein